MNGEAGEETEVATVNKILINLNKMRIIIKVRGGYRSTYNG